MRGVFLFCLTIAAMIVLHELGHFTTARRFGMKVEEFFIGFGPRIFSWRIDGTEYGLKALPLGGYVKIAGMNPLIEVPPDELESTFGAKPAWQRAVVLVAGSATHFFLGFIMFLIAVGVLGFAVVEPRVLGVCPAPFSPDCPAQAAGIRPGDKIVSIAGREVSHFGELVESVRANRGKRVTVIVERGGEKLALSATPQDGPMPAPEGSERPGGLGISPDPNALALHRESVPSAIAISAELTVQSAVQSVRSLPQIFSPGRIAGLFSAVGGREVGAEGRPVGLLGVGRMAGELAIANRTAELVQVLAYLTIFLAIFNLIPLPPLDGGYLLIVAIEKLRGGRKVDMRKLIPVMAAVMGFLVLLFLVLIYLDIFRPIQNPLL